MNKQLHPELVDATIVCACGAEYKTRSVRDTINVEVCSNCHPFILENSVELPKEAGLRDLIKVWPLRGRIGAC